MNPTIFKSPHAVLATLICAGLVGWMVMIDAVPGPVRGGDLSFLLWTGWIAFALMLIVCLYAGRKYIHRTKRSPEFKLRVPIERIRMVDSRLNDLRRRIADGKVSTRKEIQALAAAIIDQEGCSKVVRVEVEKGDAKYGEPAFRLVVSPTERFGRMLPWLCAHAYYGIASGVVTWLHGGGKFDEPMGIALNALTFIVVATGIWGWILWALAPRWLTRAETDMNYEQKFVLSARLGEKIEDEVLAKLRDDEDLGRRVRRAVGKAPAAVEREIGEAIRAKPEAQALLTDAMVLIGQKRRVDRGLSQLGRIHSLMNIWRAVHIPASIALMVVVFAHVLQVWWY
ncbi:MAG: hypothetical protein R3E53_00020 [Myxococcota bacterium]